MLRHTSELYRRFWVASENGATPYSSSLLSLALAEQEFYLSTFKAAILSMRKEK